MQGMSTTTRTTMANCNVYFFSSISSFPQSTQSGVHMLTIVAQAGRLLHSCQHDYCTIEADSRDRTVMLFSCAPGSRMISMHDPAEGFSAPTTSLSPYAGAGLPCEWGMDDDFMHEQLDLSSSLASLACHMLCWSDCLEGDACMS